MELSRWRRVSALAPVCAPGQSIAGRETHASMATLRPKSVFISACLMAFGALLLMSMVRPLIPMLADYWGGGAGREEREWGEEEEWVSTEEARGLARGFARLLTGAIGGPSRSAS